MNMRKTLLTLLSLTALVASAGHISPETSLLRALQDGRQKAKGDVTEYCQVEIASAPEIYVFQRPSGFVVTPADDTAPALLGYGDGAVKPNPAFEYFMSYLSRRVGEASERGVSLPESSRPEREPIEPLCGTKWDQREPYNNDCPSDDGGRCLTGCVATALAQLMKYHNSPPQAKGKGMYYLYFGTNRQESHQMDLNGRPFDWDAMIDSYNSNGAPTGTAEQRAAVANLMAAAGAAVEMKYSSDISRAYGQNVGKALVYNFDYSKDTAFEFRSDYGLYDWEDLIYNSLKDCGPVVYTGVSVSDSHAFICDGYSSDGLFHINWGWGGTCDGYFRLDVLDPYIPGDGVSNHGYKDWQSAVLYARPATPGNEGSPSYVMSTPMDESMSYSPYDQRLEFVGDLDEVDEGVNYEFSFGPLYNYSPFTFPATVNVGIVYESMYDSNDTTYELTPIGQELGLNYGWKRVDWFNYTMLNKGLYKVYAATSDGGSNVWPIRTPIAGPQYAIGEVADDGSLTLRYLHILPPRVLEMDAPAEVDICDGTTSIMAELYNHGIRGLLGEVRAELIKDGTVVAYGDEIEIYAPEGEPLTMDFGGRWHPAKGTAISDIKEGTYRLSLSIRNGDGKLWLPLRTPVDVNVVNRQSGIKSVGPDADVRWFDMQGRQVSGADMVPGVYIRKSAGDTRKVIVK